MTIDESQTEQNGRDYAIELDLGDQQRQRLAKLYEMRAGGIDPYPPRSHRTHTAAEAVAVFEEWEESQKAESREQAAEGSEQTPQPQVVVVGRLRLKRPGGKVTFAHLEDESGRLQLFFRINDLEEKPWDYEAVNSLLDLGDFIQAEGYMFRTRTGEPTLHVEKYHILAKSLHPLPEKYHGLSDVETRYRQRYLDLIANEDVRETFRVRSKLVSHVRRFLDARGFLEVETPILQPLYGGAAARPFVTHHNALDQDLYLRIADELYLKRLIVGGFERVYEIGHDFRNEGIDRTHNPEFTMLEFYQAYADYQEMMTVVEELLIHAAEAVRAIPGMGDGASELRPPFRRVQWTTALREAAGVDVLGLSDDEMRQLGKRVGVE